MKTIFWVGSSRDMLRSFPVEVRRRAGHELDRVQRGMEPSDWKPMPSIGAGIREIRIYDKGGYRIIYIARFEEAVYVLHVFRKQSKATSKKDITLARNRLHTVIKSRQPL